MKKNVVGPRIRELRTSMSPPVTQGELAARLSSKGMLIDRSAISRIEKQERQITDIEMLAISKALKVKVAELFQWIEAVKLPEAE